MSLPRPPRGTGPVFRSLTGLLVAFVVSAPGAVAAPLEIEAGFDTEVAGVEEAVGFWIEVRAGFRSPPEFEPTFELDNLESIGEPTRSESFRFLEGSYTRTLRHTWLLRPLSVGQAAVRGIRVRIDREVFQLPTERLRVQEEPPPRQRYRYPPSSSSAPAEPPSRRRPTLPRPRPLTSGSVFLRAETEPRDPWVGQQVLYTLYLYTQADINSIYPRRVPPFQGFWAHEVPLPRQPAPEMVEVDGERYGRVPLLKRVLFPRRPGIFEVEPAEYDLIAQGRPVGRTGSRRARPEQISRRANTLRLVVRELPPAPPEFGGAVGRFEISAHLDPGAVAVGEAATLEVALRGDGHVQSLRAPELPELPGVTVYPPEEVGGGDVERDRLTGERSWRFVLVPEQTGRWQLDDFELSYFDPRAGGYRVARAPALTLEAHPAAARATAEPPGPGGELHPIRSAAVPTGDQGGLEPALLLPWLAGLPLVLALVLRVARRRTGPESRVLLGSLAEIESSETDTGLAANRQAADRIEGAWRLYLSERWGVPPDTPARRWADVLADHPQAGPATTEPIRKLAEEIHYLRYAPQLSATPSLRRELLEHSRRVVRRLA